MSDQEKPSCDIYVLQIVWRWDHTNYEMGTLTYERYEEMCFENYEQLMSAPEGKREALSQAMEEVFEALDKSIMDKGEMVALFKVVPPYYGYFGSPSIEKDGALELNLKLQPICSFDNDGNPIPYR